ncbi:MAG TPA: zinc-ribbon domain-containing protein, partial [Acidobacteria bacterium]|nr:zinc-ribbon domain-containing protein [Acidobacteriota bacterium]
MNLTCPSCGAEIARNARFCPACGEEVGRVTCSCGAVMPPGAEVCPSCGRPVEQGAGATMGQRGRRRRDAGIRWVRNDHAVAARVTPSGLKGMLRSGLEVQPGTRALLFLGGRYVGTLAPGRHTIESLTAKLKIPTDGEPA